MTSPLPWHIWFGRGWPSGAEHEEEFVEALRSRAGKTRGRYGRVSVVMFITALRCGTDLEQMFEQAPGLKAADMLVSYERLDQARKDAVEAWQALCEEPTAAQVQELGPTIDKILPVPAARLRLALADTPESSARLVGDINRRISDLHIACDEVYQRIAAEAATGKLERAINVGRELFDPTSGHYLWAATYYLPRRVGELSPLRIIDLLGERRDDPKLL